MNEPPYLLTLAELAAAASAQLAAEGIEPGNGQVSPRVDERTLRYYATLGLLDRPEARRGRLAVYGERHLAQAVAVKRLQAAGWPLADIQRRLAAVATGDLRAVRADEPPPVAPAPAPAEASAVGREAFWAQPPAGGPVRTSATSGVEPARHVAPLAGVALPGGAVLLLPHPGRRAPTQEDATALAAAARPLLAEAARRGLLHAPPQPQPTDRSHDTEGEPR